LRTAEILAKAYRSNKLFETGNLVSEAEPKNIVDEINGNFASVEQIALVGHEPMLTSLISTLICGPGAAATIDLKKSGVCKLTIQKLAFAKCACMNWLLTPRQLARLGQRAGGH
jgi:phosphohistidine phosphatase SixA